MESARPLTCAIKMAATASYKAVPSMLMVAPMGMTKRVTLMSILFFSSRHWKVTGKVPELGGGSLSQNGRRESGMKRNEGKHVYCISEKNGRRGTNDLVKTKTDW